MVVVTGIREEEAMSHTVFEELRAAGQLPTPPGVVVQLLELTRQEDVTAKQISDTITCDPVLTAKILRFANSPMAGVAREVTSIQRAVGLIGIRGVNMMALSCSVLGAEGTEQCQGFDAQQFGIQSVACGVAARKLASALKQGSAPEAFLVGLLSQIGRSVLAKGLPEEYARVIAAAQQIPRDLPPLEQGEIGDDYASVGAQLLRSWKIPDALCSAIECFRDSEADANELARILRVAEVAAGIICPDTKGKAPDPAEFHEIATTMLGIDESVSADMLSEMATEIEETRQTLELPAGTMRSPEELQHEVRERVAEVGLAMEMENRLMAQRQAELLRQATVDALTGVGNRAAFDARMELELNRACRSGTPFALLMIDVDEFRTFNDTYGHLAGDCVLAAVARTIGANVREVDFVARYGGEEFAVIAPDTRPEDLWFLAERLRLAVETASVVWEEKKLGVTISIGAAAFREIGDSGESTNVIKAADELLYAAKNAGRNRVELAMDGTRQSPPTPVCP